MMTSMISLAFCFLLFVSAPVAHGSHKLATVDPTTMTLKEIPLPGAAARAPQPVRECCLLLVLAEIATLP